MTDDVRTIGADEESGDAAEDDDLDPAADTAADAAGGTEEDDYEDDDEEFDDVTCAERVLDVCIRAIVDDEDAVEIEPDENGSRLTLHVSVAQEDMGKIIGKRGRVATALRTLVKAAGGRDGYSATVEIDD